MKFISFKKLPDILYINYYLVYIQYVYMYTSVCCKYTLGIAIESQCMLVILRWYGTLRCCDVLFMEINNKTKRSYLSSFFPNNVTYHRSAVG